MATYAEQISAFENKRAANLSAMDEIMAKAAEEGSTLDAAQQEEFDNLQADNEAIDSHLKRLRTMEKAQAATAKPAKGANADEGTASRDSRSPIIVKEQKVEPGIRFARFARCMILGKRNHSSPLDIAKQLYGERDPQIIQMVEKANVQ